MFRVEDTFCNMYLSADLKKQRFRDMARVAGNNLDLMDT